MTTEYKFNPKAQEKIKDIDFTKFTMPTIRKVYPSTIASGLISVQPMGKLALYKGGTYWVKCAAFDTWETCVKKDLYSPDYIPHFGITNGNGYAIYDANHKPIICTDRKIFKKYTVSPENAYITDKPVSLANPYEPVCSQTFFLNYKATKSINPKDGMIGTKPPE